MATNNLLTIKEFAELAGKSQQTIYKRLNNRLNPYVQLVEGQKMLEKRALQEVYGVAVEQPFQPNANNQFNPETPLYVILKAELAAKNEQLATQTAQIDALQAELATERQHSREQSRELAVLAERAQQLHAGTIQQQLEEPPTTIRFKDEPAEKQKSIVGFFKGLFSKNE